MTKFTLAAWVLSTSVALVGLVSCEGQGPVEKAGKEMSGAATDAMEQARDVEGTLEEAARKTAVETEKAGE